MSPKFFLPTGVENGEREGWREGKRVVVGLGKLEV